MQAAAQEFAVECSAVKVFCTEAESRIVDEALQVYGGYGFTEEFPIARIYRDARISRIYEGTNEINRVAMADRFMRRYRDGRTTIEPTDFVTQLCAKAISQVGEHQSHIGAFSDLLLIAFVNLSAAARGKRVGGNAALAANRFANWANIQAARAFQTISCQAVTVPAPHPDSTDELAEAILTTKRPL